MPNRLNPDTFGKFQNLIVKNPIAFVAAVFFLMFFGTYYINIRKNSNEVEVWKTLYEKERAEKDRLKDQLLIRAGIIEKQNEIIKEVDSTLRDNTEYETIKILENEG